MKFEIGVNYLRNCKHIKLMTDIFQDLGNQPFSSGLDPEIHLDLEGAKGRKIQDIPDSLPSFVSDI